MRITVELGRRDLLVVAGLPGAGKSTLLGRLSGDITVLDPDQVRGWLAARLPAGTRYRHYRPIVHVWQRLRVAFAAVLLAPRREVGLRGAAGGRISDVGLARAPRHHTDPTNDTEDEHSRQ